MLRRLALALPLLFASTATAQTQRPPDSSRAAFDSAEYDWRAGRYPAALEQLGRLVASPAGPAVLERAALLTGELYHTDSLAADGRELRWSADGRYAAYSFGTGPAQTSVIVDVSGEERRNVTIAGRGLVFAPSGAEAAWFEVTETPEIAAVRASVDSLIRVRDAAGFRRARGELSRLESESATIHARDLRSGRVRALRAPGLAKQGLAYAADGILYLIAAPVGDPARSSIYSLSRSAPPVPVVDAPGRRADVFAAPGGRYLVYRQPDTVAVHDLSTGVVRTFPARAYTAATNGSAISFVQRDSGMNSLVVLPLTRDAAPLELIRTDRPLDNQAFSPDGSRIVFQMMPRENWELYLADVGQRSDSGETAVDSVAAPRRLTHEVQHDLFPRFLDNDRILAVLGEARHRRSYIHDLSTGERTRFFHNNTVRTVSAEYEWAASPDGSKVLIVAERDGNTISPERSVFLTDLSRRVTVPELQARIRGALAAETALRERGRQTFTPIEARVREVVDAVSVGRIYDYGRDLQAFGSKYITEPGNRRAIEYLSARLREFGYEPELQWFEPQSGARSANVIARLTGSADPSLVYVISSHFDSVEEGPGSDDNTSGTSALLEAARVLASQPQAATIEFAFFTGEEAGLLGSREYVRRAVAGGKRIVGALNNDMIGFANDERFDNTIRYSNDGLRDLQHAAAFMFTDLITYDARYYKNTDAHAYYEQYGDIVGGIGSYPILGNPHYHQSHDVLETVDHRLIAEVSKTTAASIMAMASAPSRVSGLSVSTGQGGAVATWQPAAESAAESYVVVYGPESEPMRHRVTTKEARAVLPEARPGMVVGVKTVAGGSEGWDWMRTRVP